MNASAKYFVKIKIKNKRRRRRRKAHGVDTRGESPLSFCNGLGTIYIAFFLRNDLWFYYQSMGSEFRYFLGKVLGTQYYQTLRLASHHCVLCLNLIKNKFNTCILTHTSMHLTYNMASFIPKHISYQSIKQKRAKPTHIYKS